MRHLGMLLLGSSIAFAACASNNNAPPPASSETVAQATDQPNKGPDFSPAASDGVAAAPADTHMRSATAPAPAIKPTANDSTGTASTGSGTWGTGADGSSGMDPSTGNAAAATVNRGPEPTSADNSRVNRRDREGTLTPMDQGPSAADRQITQQIRQAVMKDKSLSFTAKNVKIITQNGKVTLRGPVKSEAERTAIEEAARRIAGGGAAVDSQLELAK